MTSQTAIFPSLPAPATAMIALVGQPNVGKSALFQRLTGQRAIVANYPGTTVEVARHAVRQLPGVVLVDTPGVITFPAHTEDEQVTSRILFEEPLDAILQVGDAKNLRRTLMLTIQLAELGLPLVLALNMIDEAEAHGLQLDTRIIQEQLGVAVVTTAALSGRGVSELTQALSVAAPPAFHMEYPEEIETVVKEVLAELPSVLQHKRGAALTWLAGDQVSEDWLRSEVSLPTYQRLEQLRLSLTEKYTDPLATVLMNQRQALTDILADQVLSLPQGEKAKIRYPRWGERLGKLAIHPVWGTFILAGVLLAMYEFVGVFGAGTLVGLLEEHLFAEVINPWVVSTVSSLIPIPWLVDFLVGEFGLWTMGVTYAFALILPIVATFFLAFGVLEDSGYLPRLAALSDRGFRALGLNGKAVLPMVLGLGCVTMAALTTRILESKRERLLVTLLLALAVPCSAQLGVVMGMLAGLSLGAALIWSSAVLIVLFAVGWLAARLVPGERTPFLVDLPPMRWPNAANLTLKTLARLEWYFREVLPLFLIGAALMFTLQQLGVLAALIKFTEPLVSGWLWLPPEASAAFLMGFLRRDFGATGLFVLGSEGMLSPAQVVVAMVTITLFIPCMASVLMIGRERGWRTALGMLAMIFPLAFLVGGVLARILQFTGWGQ
jgi:ferrous iron transport protein B